MPTDQDYAALLKRLETLEDEKRVRDLLTRYAFTVDCGDEEAMARLYSPDCVVYIDDRITLRGAEVRQIVLGEAHQSILPNCSHLMGPFVVEVDGDSATATGYAIVCVKEEAGSRIWRQSYGRWELKKTGGKWLVAKRWSRSVGREDAHDLFRDKLSQA